jgi:hypothetical protein
MQSWPVSSYYSSISLDGHRKPTTTRHPVSIASLHLENRIRGFPNKRQKGYDYIAAFGKVAIEIKHKFVFLYFINSFELQCKYIKKYV